MLFAQGRCTAALDWEGATYAGPLVDLGWWLLFDAMHAEDYGVARLAGLSSREETIRHWEERTGRVAADLGWYEILAGVCLAIRRERGLGLRRAMSLPVAGDDDPRSVKRLLDRVHAMIARY
jgi:aminoglycoside phosphotransferase (APT) family kinase protein